LSRTHFFFLAKGHDPLFLQLAEDSNEEPASILLERIRAEREASPPVKSKRGKSTSAPTRARASKGAR
jgi:hypothetical protein